MVRPIIYHLNTITSFLSKVSHIASFLNSHRDLYTSVGLFDDYLRDIWKACWNACMHRFQHFWSVMLARVSDSKLYSVDETLTGGTASVLSTNYYCSFPHKYRKINLKPDSKLTDHTTGLQQFGWQRHDGRSFGRQELRDGHMNLTTSFAKRFCSNCRGEPSLKTQTSMYQNLLWCSLRNSLQYPC